MARPRKEPPPRVTVDHLDEIEDGLELLKVAYERYFNGVDRVPPAREHERAKRGIRTLTSMRQSTTALRFRANGLRARMVTYEHYWTRILKQIETGSFKRLLAVSSRREQLAQQRRAERAEVLARGDDPDAPRQSSDESRTSARAALKPRETGTRAVLPDGFEARDARELFKKFVAAKKSVGQATGGLTYKKLVDKLAREVPKLREKHGGDIRFEVSTVDGKVRLRARRSRHKTV